MSSLTWEELCGFRETPPTTQLVRSEHVQREYEAYKAALSGKRSVAEDIAQRLWVHRSMSHFESVNAVIAVNNFPYHCERDIRHLVIWMENENEFQQLLFELERKVDPNSFIIFSNHRWNKSVLDLPHYHLFLKDSGLAEALSPVLL